MSAHVILGDPVPVQIEEIKRIAQENMKLGMVYSSTNGILLSTPEEVAEAYRQDHRVYYHDPSRPETALLNRGC